MRALLESIPILPGESFACRQFRTPRFEMPWHFHAEYELTLIVQAEGTRYVGDSVERFGDGDLVLLGRNLPHYWWKDSRDRRQAHSIVIQFTDDFLGASFFEAPELAAIRKLLRRAARGVAFPRNSSGGGAVAARMQEMGASRGWRRLSLLLECLGRLAEAKSGRPLASVGYSPVLDENDGSRMTAVCQYVNRCYAETIQHQRAASLARLSPSAFSRFFCRRMGKTFEAYVNEIRIGHARRLLTDPDLSITEIAFQCGYHNLSNFNRRFRALTAMSPREYRRLYLEEGPLRP